MTVPRGPGEQPDEAAPDERTPGGRPTGDRGAGDRGADEDQGPDGRRRPSARERKAVLLRLDPAVHDALARWASDELRSLNAQIDLILRDALTRADRLPGGLSPPRRPGRPTS